MDYLTKLLAHFQIFTLSMQERRILEEVACDLQMWKTDLTEVVPNIAPNIIPTKQLKQKYLGLLLQKYNQLKELPKSYPPPPEQPVGPPLTALSLNPSDRTILGKCPVDSHTTRCCQLLTLDAVMSCGFDCSYCSIQSFYNKGLVQFDPALKEKLEKLQIDKNKTYHIGTGQSSDSLMWGNQFGLLDILFDFARKNPNVILEFKTKSNNVAPLLQMDLPNNCIFTWSLNPQAVIAQEEHKTASLEERLDAAAQLAKKGALVGFHFHPMIYYRNYQQDYLQICQQILKQFQPEQIAMISMGTLTFTKKVIKQIRERGQQSTILKMPMVPIGKKFSYPLAIKQEMFSSVYQAFKPWHDQVFFYLCMEDQSLWKSVFNLEYNSNAEFESAMLTAYAKKISNTPK